MMAELTDVLELSAETEASRLWETSTKTFHRVPLEVSSLLEALALGIRAVEILGFHRIEPVRAEFPATIASHLEPPTPEIRVIRDAVQQPRSLGFRELLDLVSDDDLSCVALEMHHGWEDRRSTCVRGRTRTHEATGFRVGESDRAQLLLLLAYRNRVFRYPPPVRIVVADIVAAFPRLEELVERLKG